MKKIKIISLLFIIFLFTLFIKNNSYAATSFKGLNGSPRMEIIVNEKKFDDVKIKIENYSGLDSSNIVFYTVQNGSIGTQITDENFIKKIEPTYSSDKKNIFRYTYTISNKYLNKKTNDFYIKVTDKNNSICILNTTFRIKSDGKKYKTDYAPRAFDWKLNDYSVSFTVKDWSGIKYVKLFDLNSENPAKEVFQKTDLGKGVATVTFPLDLFEAKNGTYNIKIITRDDNKTNEQTAVRVISFKVEDN